MRKSKEFKDIIARYTNTASVSTISVVVSYSFSFESIYIYCDLIQYILVVTIVYVLVGGIPQTFILISIQVVTFLVRCIYQQSSLFYLFLLLFTQIYYCIWHIRCVCMRTLIDPFACSFVFSKNSKNSKSSKSSKIYDKVCFSFSYEKLNTHIVCKRQNIGSIKVFTCTLK